MTTKTLGAVRRVYREDAEQKALIQWADLTPMPRGLAPDDNMKVGHYLFAVPNGGARNRIEAARMTGLGVRRGVADLFFSFPSMALKKHGLYIEMKAPKPYNSPVSEHQKEFAQRVSRVGYEAIVCCGWDAARNAIQIYLQRDL